MAGLEQLRLAGWKSIREARLEFRPLNILIGANGAGKSNLIDFFELIEEMINGRLQEHIARVGGADSLLHFGPKHTRQIEAKLTFQTDNGSNSYLVRLLPSPPNGLVIAEESNELGNGTATPATLSAEGERLESGLLQDIHRMRLAKPFSSGWLPRYWAYAYHFHDTSSTAPIRRACYVEANRHLDPTGGNLAAMLSLYKQKHPPVYRRILGAAKQIAPFLGDFVLEPRRLNPSEILLNWRPEGVDHEFGPHQFSDGTLRAIALCTLLLQPQDDFPELIILDEPELGLHPAAVAILTGLMKQASRHCQILAATQSPTFLNHFTCDDVIVASYKNKATEFARLNADEYREWLQEYALSELWERNIIGAGPYG